VNKMVKRNPSFKIESVEGRKSVRVSELDRCGRSLQFESLGYQKDAEKYEAVLGRLKHLLFELYLRVDPTVYESFYLKKMHKIVEVCLPDDAWRLKKDLLEVEAKIKVFLLSKSGKKLLLNKGIIDIEDPVRIPMEQLGLNIKQPLEIQKKYCLSGRPDFKLMNQIFEIKPGKEVKKRQKIQAYAYQVMLDIAEPQVKHGNKYVLLGGEKVKIDRNPFLSRLIWDPKQELTDKISQQIDIFERIGKNEGLLEPKRDYQDCQFCRYFTACNTIKRPRTEWRRIKK